MAVIIRLDDADLDALHLWVRQQIAETLRVAQSASPCPWTLRTSPDNTVEIRHSDGERVTPNGESCPPVAARQRRAHRGAPPARRTRPAGRTA